LRNAALFILSVTLCPQAVYADIYIYRGPDGERLITDKPMNQGADQYKLVSHRNSMTNAGHILAERPYTDRAITTRSTTTAADFRDYISDASYQYQVDPMLVEAVIHVESGFNPNAVSKKGATGLMQLMRATAQRYQVTNRFNPRDNIYAGVQHLSYLMNRFGGEVPLVLAAYNAGAGSVDKYSGVPPFPETQRYIKKVLSYQSQLTRLAAPTFGGR
jgi:soluble lytic murein transglycosylase-like protein